METTPAEPKTLSEAIRFFSDPDRCLAYLIPLRWPSGICCPRCACADYSFLKTRRIWKCKGCKRQFSIKVGTVLEDSPLGLDKWLTGIWLIANCRNGISSYEIHRALGICQKSAWFLLHRIRYAMKTGSLSKLSGMLESDETFIGGEAKNMHASKRAKRIKRGGSVGKAVVWGVVKRGGEVRANVVPDTKGYTLQEEVVSNVEAGSEVITDASHAYRGLATEYDHKIINHQVAYVEGSVHTNTIENYWSLLKRAIKGTYICVNPDHLGRYVDEQSFRYNVRKLKDGERFKSATTGISDKRLTYKKLTGKLPQGVAG
jgi:transposase-like protein